MGGKGSGRKKRYELGLDGQANGHERGIPWHEYFRGRGGRRCDDVRSQMYKRRIALMYQRATNGSIPYSSGEIRAMGISSYKDIEEGISGIMPAIINYVESGLSIKDCEESWNIPPRMLERFLGFHKKLNELVKAARERRRNRRYDDDGNAI
jgi:hypothetical protein